MGGDDEDLEAAYSAAVEYETLQIKTVKFKEKPSLDESINQIKSLNKKLKGII